MVDLANFQAVAVVDPNKGGSTLLPNSDGSVSIGGAVKATLVTPSVGDATTPESLMNVLLDIRAAVQELNAQIGMLVQLELQTVNALTDGGIDNDDLEQTFETRN